MDQNYWYYTLSAIPQVLAGMIALAATFSVVKLDFISKKLKDSRTDLRRFILLVTSKLDIEENEIHTIEPLNDDEFLILFKKGLTTLDKEDPFLGLGEEMFNKYRAELFRIIQSEWHSFYKAKDSRIFGYLQMKKNAFEKLIREKKEVIYLMGLSSGLIGFVIVFSLIILPLYSFYDGCRLVLFSIVNGAVLSVIVTALSISKIVKVNG